MEELQSFEMLQLIATRRSSSTSWEDSTFTNATQKPQSHKGIVSFDIYFDSSFNLQT
jgi:hypothetical protein